MMSNQGFVQYNPNQQPVSLPVRPRGDTDGIDQQPC